MVTVITVTRPGLYLCGCDPDEKQAQYKHRRTDAEGNDVCPEHGQRMYGYLSQHAERHLKGNLSDWPEYDGPILRDNRDPLLVYVMMKAQEEDEPASAEETSSSGLPSTNGHITTEPG